MQGGTDIQFSQNTKASAQNGIFIFNDLSVQKAHILSILRIHFARNALAIMSDARARIRHSLNRVIGEKKRQVQLFTNVLTEKAACIYYFSHEFIEVVFILNVLLDMKESFAKVARKVVMVKYMVDQARLIVFLVKILKFKFLNFSAYYFCLDSMLLIYQSTIPYINFYNSSILFVNHRNKPQTVLLRIITNYYHATMIVKSFEMNWPNLVEDTLHYLSIIGSTSESIFSLDCIYKQSTNLSIPTVYVKIIMYGLLPFILSLIGALVWMMIHLYRQLRSKPKIDITQSILVTSFILSYISYPIITNQTFSLFSCQKFQDGKEYLKADYEIECWVGTHQKMVQYIGIPYTLIWVFGFPIYFFITLSTKKKRFHEIDIIHKYGLFFAGLNDGVFYWEILLVNIRKFIFILCSTLLSSMSIVIKVTLIQILNILNLGTLGCLSTFHLNSIDLLVKTLH
ncbi:UNKNOWN [Stylonychia lemnae]|uniref:Uncharacterized protein n=1 Tax=Stylonychia lemnae TaxID=5949 RepID=A0A077ZSQ5_STYLE|nr:UNKNOWN [Stylonychia lemnae]|eukprot:CDW72907.1 UNKNOWN [Stylonychia lemnae]